VYNDSHGVYRYVLRFTPLTWLGDQPQVVKTFPLQPEWTTVSGDAFSYQPTFSNNAYVRGENYPSSFEGDCWINSNELYTGPIGYGAPGQAQGDAKVGLIRSKPFSIQGNSISLLVGGGNFPDACYVALVDHNTGEVLYKETGKNSNVMDRRDWDVLSLIGRSVHIEIADLSSASFGHICVDDIAESDRLVTPPSTGNPRGTHKERPAVFSSSRLLPGQARLLANVPNPFNPRTSVRFELPAATVVRVDVYDASGALIRTLLDGTRGPGQHTLEWDGTDQAGRGVASGIYFARLRIDGHVVDTHKMMLLK
jgi:hypothetical protein